MVIKKTQKKPRKKGHVWKQHIALLKLKLEIF